MTQILNDVCTLIVDCEHKTAPTQSKGIPSIRTPNIGRSRLILDNVNRVSDETYKAWTKRAIPQTDDLILAREAPIGNVAIILSNQKVCLGQRTVLIRPDKNQVDSQYICYLLLGDEIQGKIISLSNGATLNHLNMRDIRNLELPELPSLPTQRKIAAILSAYDDLIENNTRRIRILEEMAQALYREWFVKFRFPGHEKVKIVESELGMVPLGWEVNKVKETFEILGGGTPSKKVDEYWENGEIVWYTPSDLTSSNTMFMEQSSNQITELGLKKSSAKLFPPYSIMMTSRATLGIVAINTTPACTNQGFITCLTNERVPIYYIYYWLLENTNTFLNMASGATFKEISKTVFKTIDIILPSQNILDDFQRIVEPLVDQVLNIQRKNANLRRTRNLLLPKLISGEVDMENIDVQMPNNGGA